MTSPLPVTRQAVLEMLAAFGDRAPQDVDELVGSLELAWLMAEVEQRYGPVAEPADERWDAIRTVDEAVSVLRELTTASGPAEAVEATGAARP